MRGRGWGLGEKGEGIKQKQRNKLIDTENSIGIAWRKGEVKGGRRG